MRPEPSPTRQAISGLIVAAGIIFTIICGLAIALSERSAGLAAPPPTPTVFIIPTLATDTGFPGAIFTPTDTPGATVIVIPTTIPSTATATPTLTPSPTGATVTPTVQTANCGATSGWQTYTVQSGDTLFLIGLRYGLTVDRLMAANCLTDKLIVTGQTLLVPPVTPYPAGTFEALATAALTVQPSATLTGTDGACTSPNSVILSPKVGAVLAGTVSITGTANVADFASYRIEIRADNTQQDYSTLLTGDHVVIQGRLGYLNTAKYPDGGYWLRLVVLDQAGNYPERCARLVTFRNDP